MGSIPPEDRRILHARVLWAWGRIAEHETCKAKAAGYFSLCRMVCGEECASSAENDAIWESTGLFLSLLFTAHTMPELSHVASTNAKLSVAFDRPLLPSISVDTIVLADIWAAVLKLDVGV